MLVISCQTATQAPPGAADGQAPADASVVAVEAGGVGADALDNTQLTVVAVAPAADASGVEPTTLLTATFSLPLDPMSLSASTWSVAIEGRSVPGTVTYEGATATFVPNERLWLLGTYTATLSTGITDAAGNQLASPFTWSFTVRDGAWGAAAPIQSGSESASAKVALDPTGNAITAWDRLDVWASRLAVSADQWDEPTLLEMESGFSHDVELGVDGLGNAVAVWASQSAAGVSTIWGNRFALSSGQWGTATPIGSSDVVDAWPSGIAVDRDGNAFAVWSQFDGTRTNIWANRFSVSSTSWGAPTLIETDDTVPADYPRVATGANGDAIAVWVQEESNGAAIWANRYVASVGSWGTPVPVETDNAGTAESLDVAMDAQGDAIAVWRDDTRIAIRTNRFTASSGQWGTATSIDAGSAFSAIAPQLTMNDRGDAVVIWIQVTNIWTSRFIGSSAQWGEAVLIENYTERVIGAFAGIDAQGNAVAVWGQSDGGITRLAANRFVASTVAWGMPSFIEITGGDASPQALAVAPNGIAVVVGRRGTSTDDVIAKRFR